MTVRLSVHPQFDISVMIQKFNLFLEDVGFPIFPTFLIIDNRTAQHCAVPAVYNHTKGAARTLARRQCLPV